MEGLRSLCERNAIEMPNIKWWRRKKRKWEWVGGKLWPPNMFASTQEIEFYTAEKYLLLPPRKSMFDILGNRRQCLPCQHWRRWTRDIQELTKLPEGLLQNSKAFKIQIDFFNFVFELIRSLRTYISII